MQKIYVFLVFMGLSTTLFSQSKLAGKVLDENSFIPDVEVINATKNLIAKTDSNGSFQISADVNDEIVFYSKNYKERRLKVKKEDLSSENQIVLQTKEIELDELRIEKTPTVKVDLSYEALKTEKINRDQSRPQPVGVYTGEIPNGIDFIAIGGKLVNAVSNLFSDGEKKKKSGKAENFSVVAKYRFNNDFFIRKLDLNENEIDLFLTFCEMDKTSKEFNRKSGELELMDYLFKKRKEFK